LVAGVIWSAVLSTGRVGLYHAVDQHGQVNDVLVSKRRDCAAARAFFTRAKRLGPAPVEADQGRLKARLRPMRGLKSITSLTSSRLGRHWCRTCARGRYELIADLSVHDRVRCAFIELADCR
jgi:transposase-like protein